jgi:hypothetical protein
MNTYLSSAIKQFEYYKNLGERAMEQLTEEELLNTPGEESNSIAVIVNHLSGNMLSRWTNFLDEDGEKTWRNRDQEFREVLETREEINEAWNKGWVCLFEAVKPLNENDLNKVIYIRNEGHSVVEAINRQLCHYAYHVGQMVLLAKLMRGKDFKSLSIPKGASADYNKSQFNIEKSRKHFTEDEIK